MDRITENINKLLGEIPPEVTLVAVTKTHTPDEVLMAYNAGLRIFGENRVQELAGKKASLPSDITWHLIGHLQTNKVRQAVAAASVIESVDSVKLLRLIDTEASDQGKKIDCLLQFHIGSEETKTGFDLIEADETNWGSVASSLKSVRICGVMGIATFTNDVKQVRSEFRKLKGIFDNMRKTYFSENDYFRHISMGMSGDWKEAIEEGSTMIRVGTLIFGERIIK